MTLLTASTIFDLRTRLISWREKGDSLALVPTMGALHNGHMALVRAAKDAAQRVVVSIFVNPMQFSANEDLSKYPRQMEQDCKLLEAAGVDLVFTPKPQEIYPAGFVTAIDPGVMGTLFEGAVRPGHFAGVATVVSKLLLQSLPDIAFFGEKDYQQLLIIRRTVADLNIPVHIAAVPIVRDSDGLALSSRNVYLSADERRRAVALPQALNEAATRLAVEPDRKSILQSARDKVAAAGFAIDYLELVDAENLQPLPPDAKHGRLIAAARIGAPRLLDNIAVDLV